MKENAVCIDHSPATKEMGCTAQAYDQVSGKEPPGLGPFAHSWANTNKREEFGSVNGRQSLS
jgi:hypothetical protein